MVATKHNWTPEDRIMERIAWMLNVPSSKINPNTDLVDDLYLDPLDKSLLIATLERQYGIFLTREEVASIDTVGDASRYFLQKNVA